MQRISTTWNILLFDPFENRQPAVADLSAADMEYFVQVGFSLHRQVIRYASTIEERLFYIRQCATQFWTKDKLIANLKAANSNRNMREK